MNTFIQITGRLLLFFLFVLLFNVESYSQKKVTELIQLDWKSTPRLFAPTEQDLTEIWKFEGAHYSSDAPSVPFLLKSIELDRRSTVQASLHNLQVNKLDVTTNHFKGEVDSDFQVLTSIEKSKDKYWAKIVLIPIRKKGDNLYEKLESCELQIQIKPNTESMLKNPPNTEISALADGTIYKIAVSETGIHQLTYSFLKDELGVNIDDIDPRNIQLYGAGGGKLAERIATPRVDDLQEIPISISGDNDGSFDSNDKILFFAEAADKWAFNEALQQFVFTKNTYSTQNFYFLKIANNTGSRIATRASVENTAFTTTAFDNYMHYEEDKFNVLHEFSLGQGSGQKWFGDLFEVVRERSYDAFNFTNLVPNSNARIKMEFAGRSEANSRAKVRLDNQEFTSSNIGPASTGNSESTHAFIGRVNTMFEPSQGNLPVTVEYVENSATSRGWLDFIEIQVRQQLELTGKQMLFRDTTSTNFTNTTYRIANASSEISVWDISNPLNPVQQEGTLVSNRFEFGANSEELREFIAFSSNESFPSPSAVGEIPNQNLHGINDMDMVLIYPSEFEAQANQFAEHRRQFSGLEVQMVLVTDIYNEFSSGRLSPTAIRDFAKMLHDRSSKFKYLLLFGDGSFDARGLYEFSQKSDYIPIYETGESLDPIDSYPSDDYFALLSNDEGFDLKGALDIAVGRFPVKTVGEAQAVVDKIIRYDTQNDLLGDWRNRLVFVADDQDSNRHIDDADGISNFLDTAYQELNIDKIYLDAFQQISTPGGEKYPSVTEAINTAMFKGVLAMNYLGHGGSKGWAQERVLSISDIESWNNQNHYPLLVTATCSFSGYDDPAFTTAGERTLLNSKGGSIALFTTVRAVFATSNEQLARSVFQRLFELDGMGERPTIGDIFRDAKNSNSSDFFTRNARKFTLLGDPSMKLALPELNVATTAINGTAISEAVPDTLRALQKVTIAGRIEDGNGVLVNDFNGKIFPTVFDKGIMVSTLVNDPSSKPKDFSLQKNIIFKGAASVQNGLFEFSFVIPKDINYAFGEGKISYYAKDEGLRDANGSYENIVIGGTDPNVANDDQPPLVEVFMNNEDFVFGGITNENPILFVKLSDDNGINVAGSSVGHDLTGVLDENSQNNYLLNDFYEAALDDYTKGTVRFPLFDIPVGRHRIEVQAWDVANNSAKGFTEFVVAQSGSAALEHVLNYPNPFTSNTNFQFEHNLSDQLLNVQVRIFTVSGKLVKTIDEQLLADGYRVTDIGWNGTDDFGDQLARGVYLYKVKIASAEEGLSSTATESDFEKLVILK